jgi:hypothetical protein
MFRRTLRLAALEVFLLTTVAQVRVADAATDIGVTAAAQNQVEGSQGGTQRTLAAGSRIFQNETIRTGAKSMAQLLFLDQTSLSIGPQSEVVLDKFVYNPSSGVGSVVLSATKGAFRFITGTQNPVNYRLQTAIATIGARGTIIDGYVTEIGLYVQAQEGRVILTVDGVEYVLRPGQALFVSKDHKVTGPFTPDGEFFRVAGIVPFALYGSLLPGEHERVEVPDDSTIRTDDLFSHPQSEGGDEDGEGGGGGAMLLPGKGPTYVAFTLEPKEYL